MELVQAHVEAGDAQIPIRLFVGSLADVSPVGFPDISTESSYAKWIAECLEAQFKQNSNNVMLPDCELVGVHRLFRRDCREFLARSSLIFLSASIRKAEISIVGSSVAKAEFVAMGFRAIEDWEVENYVL